MSTTLIVRNPTMNSPLDDLPPEIFPIIASLLPLHATPSTLLSLALVNHRISSIVLPILNSCLILKNENYALKFLQKLLDNPELGKVVREVHIMSGLSLATRNGENPFDVLRGLEKVIGAGLLPHIHTFGLHLLTGWHYDDEFLPIDGFGRLGSEFWESAKKNCPRLRGFVIRDTADLGDNEKLGINVSGLFEIQDVTKLALNIRGTVFRQAGEKLLKKLESVCNSLHTLALEANLAAVFQSACLIFSLDFPQLRSLSLGLLVKDKYTAMAFWQRHPALEYLKLLTLRQKTRWFTSELPRKFLPNLIHLRADFVNIRVLAPILHQLVSLAVFESVNAQIPYLIRSVLPGGLPNLKSLNIGQTPSASMTNINEEGSLWYETQDGKFMEQDIAYKGFRRVSDGYMHSITRGAPNLEEIGFFTYTVPLSEFAKIASEIAGLSKLKRFYFSGPFWSLRDFTDEDRDAFLSHTRILSEACGKLMTVVDTLSGHNAPFVTGRILRDGEGSVVRVDIGTGHGMHFGNDDEAFPRNV